MNHNKAPNFFLALLPIITLLVTATLSVTTWKVGMFLPLLLSTIVTAIVGLFSGYKWPELQDFLVQGVARALPAVFILFIIGTIIGTWILSGVIPTLIYYGLAIINPTIFIPIVALVTGILSMTLGSSFTSIATLGIAFMAIGQGMGFSAPLIAGAVISGAFLGDKLSPLSDTTNIAPAMVDTDLFSHVRHMLWDTIPAFLISLVLYWLFGINHTVNAANMENIGLFMNNLDQLFVIHPALLFVPLITIIIMLKRLPAIPSLILISFIGGITAIIVQDSTLTDVLKSMTNGYSGQSEVKEINSLLNRGGITSMLSTIGLLIFATALGGLLEGTGVFNLLTASIIHKIKSTGSLILSTVLTTFMVAFLSGAQFLAIILPSRAFAETYKKRGLDTKNLSRSVEAAGTVGINLVPWSVPAIFASGVLGVDPYQFIPFIFFAFLVPIINIIYGYTGISIAKKDYSETERVTELNPSLSQTRSI